MLSQIPDKGGRRLGLDRRQFSYNDHIPERRTNIERRLKSDRRSATGSFHDMERRAAFSVTMDAFD